MSLVFLELILSSLREGSFKLLIKPAVPSKLMIVLCIGAKLQTKTWKMVQKSTW